MISIQMYRGVHPILAPHAIKEPSELELVHNAMAAAKGLGFCKPHQSVIVVTCVDGLKDVSQPLTIRLFTVA